MATHYDTLGLDPDATMDHIRAAFKKLALVHHPDKVNATNANATSENTTCDFFEIKKAYDILSDPIKRSIYDDALNNASYASSSSSSTSKELSSEWINELFKHMMVFAARPLPIVLTIDVTFADVYHGRSKRIDVRIKKRNDVSNTIELKTTSLFICLVDLETSYEFKGRGDDSILQGYPSGNVVININLVDQNPNLRIDNLFGNHDLFYDATISLHTLYTSSKIPLELCPGVEIEIENNRTLSHCIKDAGLLNKTKTTTIKTNTLKTTRTRSDLYVTFRLDIPLDLHVKKGRRLEKVLERYFK